MKDKKFELTVIFLLCLTTIILFGLYLKKDSENIVLKLKLKDQQQKTKRPISWQKVKSSSESTQVEQSEEGEIESNETLATQKEKPSSVKDMTTIPLMKEVEEKIQNKESLNLPMTNRGIELAEELIFREPYIYAAYKAKVIFLMVKEFKLLTSIDEANFEATLEQMSEFDLVSDSTLRDEALLIAKTDSELEELEANIDSMGEAKEQLEEYLARSESEAEKTLLEQRIVEIDEKLEETELEIEEISFALENDLADMEALGNQDLIELPFKRNLAREDFDQVVEDAEGLLEEFPHFEMAYAYLIRALELSAREEEAFMILAESSLSESQKTKVKRYLRNISDQNPKEFWKQLRFR
jgi:tetratricopeptide (TPR) repeat protein